MGQALYRKNRPKSLRDVVGQEHITNTLENALKKGAISHAYLFTGPRGVGKTSIARILAHEINGLPYDDDSVHLDIIEIDAASNRRIDEIRDLRDRVNIAPTSAKYKVYIIDEVHMLTREAFNALLKTLEEPPAHVVFILATTEVHKLPETIVSRTQRFTFKPVPLDKVVGHLRDIATKENIEITDDALELIARHGEGSFRDSISLLDQAGGIGGKVDKAEVERLLGIPPIEMTQALAENLEIHDAAQTIKLLGQLHDQGFSATQVAKQLGSLWRARILEQGSATPEDLELLQKLLVVPAAHNPTRFLEIIVLSYTLPTASPAPGKPASGSTSRADVPSPVSVSSKLKPTSSQIKVEAKNLPTNAIKPDETTKLPEPESPVPSVSLPMDDEMWQQLLAELKKKYNTLYGVVRMAQPRYENNTLVLGFTFAFHRKRLSEAKNQTIIREIVNQLTGKSVSITCVEADPAAPILPEAAEFTHTVAAAEPAANQMATATADIANISNIFGGGEVLQK